LVIGAGTAACERGELKPVLVVGTERICPGGIDAWFTISPDEQWLAFMHADSLDEYSDPLTYHLETLDIATGRVTQHQLGGLADGLVSSDMNRWWEAWFTEKCWSNGRLFMKLTQGTPNPSWIAFTPGVKRPEGVPDPGDLTCCACGPFHDWKKALDDRGLDGYGQEGTAAYQKSSSSAVIYALPLRHDWQIGAIDRIEEDGSVTRVFDDERVMRAVTVERFLVSPDGRYLAFVLGAELKSPIPLPPFERNCTSWI
jgi:hypothetical protein